MTREEQLLQLQRRIATAKGYTDLQGGAAGKLTGVLHAEEGRVLVPQWPWNLHDARPLLDEIHTAPVNSPGYSIDFIQTEQGPRVRFTLCYCMFGQQFEAETQAEAISIGWCANHHV